MKEYIGLEVIDKDGAICKVTDATSNSVEVWIGRKSDKGIDAKNWFTEKNFKDRFSTQKKYDARRNDSKG